MFEPHFAPRAFDENSPHRLRRRAKEVAAALPVLIFAIEQPQPRFMHQRRGLQGLPGGFLRHARRRQPAQFIINSGSSASEARYFPGPRLKD